MTDGWIGVDIGTQSLRAIAITDDGVSYGPIAVSLQSRIEGELHEQDPHEWISAARQALGLLMREVPDSVIIRALVVDGTSGTIVPLHADGSPAGMAVMYDDRRGAPFVPAVREAGAGLWTRMGYEMQASWGLPRLLALKERGGFRHVGHQPDVVVNYLSQQRLPTDLSSALKTGADLDTVSWPAEVFDRLGMDARALPSLVASGTIIGVVHPAVATELGLPHDIAIVGGTTDGVAAQLAAGAVDEGMACTVLGTTLVIKAVAAIRVGDPASGIYSHRAPLSDQWYPGGASNVGAGSFSKVLPDRDLIALTREAEGISDIPISYPLLRQGERFPIADDSFNGFWPTHPAELSDVELFRTIAIGIGFVERFAYDRLEALGAPVRSVVTTGGGARNPWWLALRSAILQRPVAVPLEPESAQGAALLACAGYRKEQLSATVRQYVPAPRQTSPAAVELDQLEDAYSAFLERVQEVSTQ